MTSQIAYDFAAGPRLGRLPITGRALRRLRAEARRLRDRLNAGRRSPGGHENPGVPPGGLEAAAAAHRLRVLDSALDAAVLVVPDGRAVVGSRVTIREADGSRVAFTLVPPGIEAPGAGRISPDSPLGAALLDRRAGDRVRVAAPAGRREILVVEVR